MEEILDQTKNKYKEEDKNRMEREESLGHELEIRERELEVFNLGF